MSTAQLMKEKMQPIWSVGEVALTYKRKSVKGSDFKIKGARDVRDFILERWDDPGSIDVKEKFYAMFLNRSNRVMSLLKVSEGGISGTTVDIRHIAVTALLMMASSVIVVHNHPSGNLKPSEGDMKITHKMKNAFLLIDIELLDHVILTSSGEYSSMADDGII